MTTTIYRADAMVALDAANMMLDGGAEPKLREMAVKFGAICFSRG